MKSRLQLLFYNTIALCAFIFSSNGYSQINYSQNFESENFDWFTGDGFFPADYLSCSGNSLMAEVYNIPDFDTFGAFSTSGAIGISNGQLATLSYNFKILGYDNLAMPNNPDWGTFTVEYATSLSGPWTVIQTISPSNHVESEDCVVKTATFTPAGGNNVYLRITGMPNVNEDISCLFYIDDITVNQAASLPCTGTPTAMTTIAAKPIICSGEAASLSLNPYPISAGLVFQWQSSLDGVTYTNVAGGTGNMLTAPQLANTWYRANVSCGVAGVVVTSTPVKVTNSGIPCLCEVVFNSDVEPITRVQFAGIDNSTSPVVNGTPGTENFANITPAQVIAGVTYPIVLEGNANGEDYDNYFKVYIDFNHNGNLNDAGESFEIGYITGSNGNDGIQALGNIVIPNNATLGLTYMRVFKLYDEYSIDSCSNEDNNYNYGQVEDYILNIVAPCATAAPVATSVQTLCGGATVSNLQATGTAVKWYLDALVGSPLGEAIPLVDGTVYYASQTIGCESNLRTAVTVTISEMTVAEMDDVTACFEYVLPALENGTYYTATNGGGTVLATGTVITANTTVYVYVVSDANPACTAEDSFTITINTPAAPSGDNTIEYVINEGEDVLLYDVELDVTGQIVWYASLEDATNGVDALPEDLIIPVGTTEYYATQIIGECESTPLKVTVTVEISLGREDFDTTSFRYYPNPVADILNISYSKTITGVTVFNLLGQEVVSKVVSQGDVQIDLSQLAVGTYMVKVQSEDTSKVIKVVKK